MININGFFANIANGVNTVVSLNSRAGELLQTDHFLPNGAGRYLIDCHQSHDQVRLFNFLQQYKFAFSAGRDWSPAEVFELFREQGLVAGEYLRISWFAPGQSIVAIC